jgi:Yip1 domain
MRLSERTAPPDPYKPPSVQNEVAVSTKSATKGIDLSRQNPFLTIWTRPRSTIRGIVNTNPDFRVLPIAIAGGMLEVLQLESMVFAGDQLTVLPIVLIAVVLGPPVGLILLYAGAWIVEMSCRLLGGQADSSEVRSALAWSSVPFLATIPLWILRLACLGRELFTLDKPSLSGQPALAYFLAATVVPELILSVWWMLVTVKALGEVQRFSAWRALSSMLLLLSPVIVLIVILAIVAYFLLTNLLY